MRAHARAIRCCTRPLPSNAEAPSDSVPIVIVNSTIRGSVTRRARSLASMPVEGGLYQALRFPHEKQRAGNEDDIIGRGSGARQAERFGERVRNTRIASLGDLRDGFR